MGMVFASELIRTICVCSAEVRTRISALLTEYGLPIAPPEVTADECVQVMTVDKKVASGRVRFVLLNSLGTASLSLLDFDQIYPILADFLKVPA